MRLQTLIRRVHARRAQAGATAVEFALVFPVFFLLFYGLLTYGLIFLMRMGLQHAAEEGARAALVYPVPAPCIATGDCTAGQISEHQISQRLDQAFGRASQQASWMNGWQPPQIDVRICAMGMDCVAQADVEGALPSGTVQARTVATCNGAGGNCTPANLAIDCGSVGCQVVVTLSYNYAAHAVLPRLPGFGLVTPSRLVGQARLLLDQQAIAS